MKILIVSQYFWPENFRVNDLAAGLVERNHQVTVLTGVPNYPEGRAYPGFSYFGNTTELYRGCEVVRVPMIPRGRSRGFELALNYLSFAASASIFGPLRLRDEHDVIFVFEPSPITVGIPAMVLKRLRGIPLVFWVLDLWPESLSATGAIRSQWLLSLFERVVRRVYRACDVILASSRRFIPSIMSHGADAQTIRYFPNWAEEVYQPVAEEPSIEIAPVFRSGFRVMFAGNIGAAQDFGTILRAAEHLSDHPEIQWIIAGDGRMRPWVEEEIAKRRLEKAVHLVGSYPMERMPQLFYFADSMLVTLNRDPIFSLTAPGKIQSFLACGKPIVAALSGEGREVIEESGAGFTCDPEDPAALAEAVLRMYRLTPQERHAMGEAGREYYCRNFERRALIDQLEAWLTAAAGR